MNSGPRYVCRAKARADWPYEVVWHDGEKLRNVIVRANDPHWTEIVCRLLNAARVSGDWQPGTGQ